MKYKLLFFFFLLSFLSCKENDIIKICIDYNKEIKSNVSDQYVCSEHIFRLDNITFKGIVHNHLQLKKRDTNRNSMMYSYASVDSLVIDNGSYIKVDNSVEAYEALYISSENIESYSNVKEMLGFLNKQDSIVLQRKDRLFSTSFKNKKYQGYVKEYLKIDSLLGKFSYTNKVYLELGKQSLKINHTTTNQLENIHLINNSRQFVNSIEIYND
ncbi:MAG: hypothetical protein N4A35_11385 [Flavobacteriales bacterium]|jgi:putative lipase involved disintegration of autophagic bodies|nr:hypothetical protein [Flavobacteriales bacterium]